MGNESSTIKQTQQVSTKKRLINSHRFHHNRTAKKELEMLGNELIKLNNVQRNTSFNSSKTHQQHKQDLPKPNFVRCLSSA